MFRRPRKLVRLAAATAGLLLISLYPGLVTSALGATDVTAVEFDGGSYRQVAPGRWAEFDAAGNMAFQFDEISRDDNTVSLEDTERGVALTLDIAGGSISFGSIGGDQELLHDITASSAEPVADAPATLELSTDVAAGEEAATAESATVVVFGADGTAAGQYVQLDSGQWAELDASGNSAFTFEEAGRGTDGIELVDESRGIALTLDIANGVITYGAIGDPQEPLYSIISASNGPVDVALAEVVADQEAGPISPPVPGVDYRFIKLKNTGWYVGRFTVTWAETDSAGQVTANQFESGEQAAPYFQVLEFPDNASAITVVAEGEADGTWTEAASLVLAGPTNRCYELTGTASAQSVQESDDPSNTTEDDCP